MRGRTVTWQLGLVFVLLVPLSAAAYQVFTGHLLSGGSAIEGAVGWVSYVFVFPGWYLALWIWGYRSAPTAASISFIVLFNSALFATPVYGILVLIARAFRSRETAHAGRG